MRNNCHAKGSAETQAVRQINCDRPHCYNNILIWAACCLANFGFLWVGEFTTPSDTRYEKDCHLSIDDISIDSRDNLQLLKVTIKQSKTDPFRVGVDLYLWATGATICPVKGLLPYLALSGHHKGSTTVYSGRWEILHTPVPLSSTGWPAD